MARSALTPAGLVLALLLAACSPATDAAIPAPTGSVINVGTVLSLTGSQSAVGQMAKEGYLFCQDWINNKGGVTIKGVGHRLSIAIDDDQSRPSLTAAAVEQMVSQRGIKLLLGPGQDAALAKAAPVADQHQVPLVSGGGSSEGILNNHYHYLFTVLAPNSRQLQGVIDMALAQNPKPQSMAILFASDSLSSEVANATVAYATANGLGVVFGASYPTGVNDLRGQLGAAAGAGTDMIFEVGHPSESVRTIQQAQQLGIQPKLFAFSDGPGAAEFTGDLRKSANYAVGTTQWSPAARNPISYFLDSYHYAAAYAAQFGHLPDQHSAAATAACLTLEVGMERAASTEPQKVRDAVASVDLQTFFGRIKFDERGANTAKPVYVEQVQSGRTVLIWPPEIASARPHYPDPGWAKR